MEPSLILDVRDLTVAPASGAGAPLLDGINLRLQASEIFGIYGESGAGKTILSRALADWLPQNLSYRSGAIAFAGKDILGRGARSSYRIGRDIAYIGSKPQSALDPTQPVGVQIAEKLRSVRPEWTRKERRERVIQLLGEVRIPSPKERYDEYPAKFSGGMMQRAVIVDAICAEPAVLIADNITQPLDVTIGAQIVALLHDLLPAPSNGDDLPVLLAGHPRPVRPRDGDPASGPHRRAAGLCELDRCAAIGIFQARDRKRAAHLVIGQRPDPATRD